MKIIKIVVAIIAIVILGVIGLSAYIQFEKRTIENQITEKGKELKPLLKTLGERKSRGLNSCRVTVGFGGEKFKWKCADSVNFVDKRKKSSPSSEPELGADGKVDTLIFKASASKEESIVCAFPLPVEEGPRNFSGILMDRCEITIGESVGSPQLNDNDRLFVKDGINSTTEDSVILEINEAEVIWYNLPENSLLRDQPVSLTIHFVFDSRDILN